MKTSEFIKVAQKLKNTGLINVLGKGKHGNLGATCIGETDNQNTKLWRNYGTLENIVIFETAEKANEILKSFDISEFVAKPTKSGTMCRLKVNR